MSRRFDIAWPRKVLQWRRRERGEVWMVEAVLLERRLCGDKPAMQMICKLASIDEEHASPEGAIAVRDAFWHAASARLGRLYRLTDRDLDEIEAVIAERIGPKPLPEAVELGKVRRQA
jgi:hypothetical protein